MVSVSSIASLAFTGLSAAAPGLMAVRQADDTATNNVTLSPITMSSASAGSFTPKYNVSLPYGQAQSVFNVSLTTSDASVLLESISSLVSADCSSDSVSMTFDNADDLDSAYSEWSSHRNIVLVTNHMGDCDSEFERGFFSAGSYTIDQETLTLVASTHKSSINHVASDMTINFSGLSTKAAGLPKRTPGDVTYSPDPVNFSAGLVLNSTVLYSNDDFTATVDSGSLSLSVTVGGYITYNILTSTLKALEIYLETNTTSDVVVDLAISASTNKTLSYEADFDLLTVDIPGVLSFGPLMSFGIGMDLAADAGVDVVLDLSSELTNGTVVLDYNGNATITGSWSPTFDIDVTISEAAGVAVTPFITSSFTLEFEVLGGEYRASGGIVPASTFPTTISLAADQGISAGGESESGLTVTQAGSAGCNDGVEVKSDFEFALDAFITGRWDDEYVYSVSTPVLDECFSWR